MTTFKVKTVDTCSNIQSDTDNGE